MHEVAKIVAEYTAYIAEVAAALVIIIGMVQAVWIYLRRALLPKSDLKDIAMSRIKLGYSLSLGLGFLVGADILKTAVAPNWQDIGQIAAIVAIRIVLNYFLMKDLKEIEASDKSTKMEENQND